MIAPPPEFRHVRDGTPGHIERAVEVGVQRVGPLLVRSVFDRSFDIDNTGVIEQDIQTSKGIQCDINRILAIFKPAHIASGESCLPAGSDQPLHSLLAAFRIARGDHYIRPFLGEQEGSRKANSRASACYDDGLAV